MKSLLFLVLFMALIVDNSQSKVWTNVNIWNRGSGPSGRSGSGSVPGLTNRHQIEEESIIEAMRHFLSVKLNEKMEKPTFVPLLKDKLRF